MAVNDLSFNQVSAFLNAVQHQVTGVSNPAPADTKDFVAVATTLLKQGYDPILNAVNQVLARTIFSIRPYSAKFRLAEIPETAYGNHTRKLSIADKDIVAVNVNCVIFCRNNHRLDSYWLQRNRPVADTILSRI